ncbi:hypothetical protein DID76_00745 [Candidatus Marinamargulisbacteria bacterium SCGC AG-414-C22]|nr:hypothetical protein DID76_00745 [Candidatus Marinamargulisbacteria bacterium SCGC AG-414-C22]
MLFFIKRIYRQSPIFKFKIKKRALKFFRNWSLEDKKRTHFYKKFLSKNDLVFDVGANIGNRCKVFLELGCRVIAVEPQQDCVTFMKQGLSTNHNIKFIQKAVGKKESIMDMYIASSPNLSSLSTTWISKVKQSKRFNTESWSNRIKVPVTTLDQLIETYTCPHFIKIDIEGFEYEALQGLHKPINWISFEFTPEHIENTLKCITYICNLGSYTFNLSLGESLTFEYTNWLSHEDTLKAINKINTDQFGDIYAQLIRDT